MKDFKNLLIDINWVDNIQTAYKYQTPIDTKRKETLVKEWNDIVNAYSDDIQTATLELARFAVNRFMNSHTLLDGNKRMWYALTNHMIKNIDPAVDLL